MTHALKSIAHATVAAKAAVAYLDEEERWVLLQKWLDKESAGRSKAAKRSLRLEALRSIVCPRVPDWQWDDIVRDHRPTRWAYELRMANALAILPTACPRSSLLEIDDRLPGECRDPIGRQPGPLESHVLEHAGSALSVG